MYTVEPKEVEPYQFYRYLTGAVSPRPIAFASTIDKNGVPNLTPFSFFTVVSGNPPMLVIAPLRTGRDAKLKDSYNNMKEVPECVVNIVNYAVIEQMNLCSAPYPPEVSEFDKSGLTPIPSDLVKPFRVKETPVQIECRVQNIHEFGTEGLAGNLVVAEILKLHIDESVLDEEKMIDQTKIDLIGRMGGSWYCRPNPSSMFEMTRPMKADGIAYDGLPDDIKSSTILTGNDLGKLGNVRELPDETEVNEYKLIELSEVFISLENNPAQLEIELHKIAKQHLDKNEVMEAWKTLLTFNNQ